MEKIFWETTYRKNIKRYINKNVYIKNNKEVIFMAKKNNNSNNGGCWHCGVSGKGVATALILIGAAYALQDSGILFSNIILWPWVLIALGLCAYLCKKKF